MIILRQCFNLSEQIGAQSNAVVRKCWTCPCIRPWWQWSSPSTDGSSSLDSSTRLYSFEICKLAKWYANAAASLQCSTFRKLHTNTWNKILDVVFIPAIRVIKWAFRKAEELSWACKGALVGGPAENQVLKYSKQKPRPERGNQHVVTQKSDVGGLVDKRKINKISWALKGNKHIPMSWCIPNARQMRIMSEQQQTDISWVSLPNQTNLTIYSAPSSSTTICIIQL